jgi:hypothetical protein
MTGPAALPCVISAVRGRIRLHVPGWFDIAEQDIERRFVHVDGVHRARANELTGNVLVHFDPTRTDTQRLLAFARGLAHTLAPIPGAAIPANAGCAPAARRYASDARAAIPARVWPRPSAMRIAPVPKAPPSLALTYIAAPPAVHARPVHSRAGQLLRCVAKVIEYAPFRSLIARLIGEATIGWLLAACDLARIFHALFFSRRHPVTLVGTGADAVRLAGSVSSLIAA